MSCDACPGETVTGRVVDITPAAVPAAGKRVRVRVENPRGDLRPGLYAAAKFRTPVARADAHKRLELERWRERAAAGLALGTLGRFDGPLYEGPLFALLDAGARQAAARGGLVLGVPESAVIDTGALRVVYVESMPGVFDAVEVRLGRRCGDFYPAYSGLEWGQRVATAGAVLLDAESRLNPSVAASYFGSGPRPQAATQNAPAAPASDDRQLIARQKICPVSGEDLYSMTGPVKVIVQGRVVFVCCKSCEKPLLKDPEQYLPKLPK